ncbi:MAG TPA: hypothetical protein VGM54_00580 [Chthoniobacter sp.]
MPPAAYTEASIKTLSSLEHIRLRPRMYIGRLGNGARAVDGIYGPLKETIDHSIDEFTVGYGKGVGAARSDLGRCGTCRLTGHYSAPTCRWILALRMGKPGSY